MTKRKELPVDVDFDSRKERINSMISHPEYYYIREEVLSITHVDGARKNSKCRESYIFDNFPSTYQKILSHNVNFASFNEKLAHITYMNGYCLYCYKQTKLCTSGGGFTNYCNVSCASRHKTRIDKNRVFFDEVKLRDMYLVEFKTPHQIGEYFGCSNVTVGKELKRLGIHRTHSEQQSIHATDKDVWNYNGFDRDKASNISYIKEENKIRSIASIAEDIGCTPRVLHITCENNDYKPKTHFHSNEERKLRKFLDDTGILYANNDRVTFGKEIDIYIPFKNIAIEVNGVYWHSEFRGKNETYHINKTKLCATKDVQLLHFWDYEINEKYDIVKSIIKSKLNLTKKLHARKCNIRDVSRDDAFKFCFDNHLQGYSEASIRKGLYLDDKLVALATFAKPRFKKDYDLELVRFCTLLDHMVIGGMSKLLNTVSEYSIISYANIRISNGAAYEKCGFSESHTTRPDFFYYHLKTREMMPRYRDMRALSILQEEGWSRVWGCGNKVYVKNKKEL